MSTPIPIRSERRLGVVFVVFVLAFAVVVARLAQLQFLEAGEIEEKIRQTLSRTESIPAFRGGILDRHGRPFVQTTTSYEIAFFPTRFRERNKVDALQDLLVIWQPQVLPAGFGRIPENFRDRVDERLRRYRKVYELRDVGVRALLQMPVSSLTFEKESLVQRFGELRHPRGELILPPSKLKGRLESALLILADNEICNSRRSLLTRLGKYKTLGDVLATTSEEMVTGIEAEWESLRHLADQILPENSAAFLAGLIEAEQWNIKRTLRLVERCLDDQICSIELGTHDLENRLDKSKLEELAAELRVGASNPADLDTVLDNLRAEVRSDGSKDQMARLSAAEDILSGHQSAVELEAYERESLAKVLEFWDTNPRRLKTAYARSIKNAPGFKERRGEYLSIEKEWHRTLSFKDGVPYTVFRGCNFAVAASVWRSYGLSELGLSVSSSQGREYWEDQRGVAAQLIGRCNSRGVPLGGLEASLTRGRPGSKAKGPLIGKAGLLRRQQGLDGQWRIVDGSREPRHGSDVMLTLDRDLQAAAEELAQDMVRETSALTGAAFCVIDVETGEIIVLASAPRARGSEYVRRFVLEADLVREKNAARKAYRDGEMTQEERDEILRRVRDEREDLAFYERSIESGFTYQSPPGSVLKPFAAALFLMNGTFTTDEFYNCPDKGRVNVWSAIERSSNYYFWEGAKRLKKQALIDWYHRFGMLQPMEHLIPASTCDARMRQVENAAAKNIVIGQGSVSLSVLEVASMMTNLARRGDCLEPTIIRQIGDQRVQARSRGTVPVEDWVFKGITDAMEKVARHYIGGELTKKTQIAGKTGTAELGGKYKGLYNAWFAGFAPANKPRYAFAVVSERSRMMGKSTAPFAARLMELVMKREK